MTVAIQDGILGLEAVHAWVYNNQSFDLNDLSAMPRTRLIRIPGLHSLPDADDNRELKTGRSGEQLYPSHSRGRTVTYEGVIEATSLQSLRRTGNGMRRGFQRRYDNGVMTVSPHEAYGSVEHFYNARVIAYDSDDEQTRSPQSAYRFSRDFVLSVRQGDARSYVVGQQSVDGTNHATVNCSNLGYAPTDPIVQIKGSITNATVVITRGDGKLLTFVGLSCAGGQTIDVDFFKREAHNETTGDDWTGRLDNGDSNWWDENQDGLRPETVETVTVDGAAFTVKWYHANP